MPNILKTAAAITVCWLLSQSPTLAQLKVPVQIVGIGATSCGEFVREARENQASQRYYLAWLQGYISGLVVGRPAGVDEGVNLSPKDFPLRDQALFIRDYCSNSLDANFADAVEALFRKLRQMSSN
jgi:hypothetical protein